MRKIVTTPAWLIVLPALLSMTVWLIPWSPSVRRGFVTKEPFSLVNLVVLIGWYGLLAVAATVACTAGRAVTPLRSLDEADDARVYRLFTVIGGIGVIGMYLLVELRSPGLIVRALGEQQFNLVRQQIPKAPGLATLRYATIVSGGIALHRRLVLREKRGVHYFNIVMLILNVLVASRLALLMSILIFIGLVVTRRNAAGPRKAGGRSKYVLVGLLVLAVLTVANYSRNANYYRVQYGTNNPFSMLLGETVAYVDAPFQVSLGTARAASSSVDPIATGWSPLEGATSLSTPSFFVSTQSGAYQRQVNWYRGDVSVDLSLTTNSSFASEFGLLGLWEVPFMALVSVVAGFLMGHLSGYRSYLALGSFILGYCFAEVWRTYLFDEGIVWFLLIALVIGCALARPRKRGGSSRSIAGLRSVEQQQASR